jgi:photosystem II stability/assembly factor-like uncharacterized protein
VVADSGIILKTNDGGQTWLPQTSGTDVALFEVFFIDAERGWIVGDRGTILKTTTGGDS